ncbi:MAG: aminotransferase class IV, partial [Flavobacteriales bacterium]|nr:aminotransferase class IV [Flavobacteriales bacterium]
TIKSTNKLIYTLASIYAQEHALDNCILLNERKGVVEVANANIFLVKDSLVKTPSLSEGCLNGIIRAKVIDILSKNDSHTIEESIVTPFEIQKADEIFITNCLMGIQPVTKYRKKEFKTGLARKLQSHLKVMEVTSGGQLR